MDKELIDIFRRAIRCAEDTDVIDEKNYLRAQEYLDSLES